MRPCIRGGNGVTSRTFQGVCACGFGRLGCRATRKRQAQHHTTKVRTARPQTLPSSHASANAAILWGPRAHHRGTGGDEVTQARRHTTSPQLCESHYTPAFLNEMAEDVVTQQHGTRARTVEQHRRWNAPSVCVCAFLRRNGNCDDRFGVDVTVYAIAYANCAFPFVCALAPCCCVTTSSVISFKNAGMSCDSHSGMPFFVGCSCDLVTARAPVMCAAPHSMAAMANACNEGSVCGRAVRTLQRASQ